MANVLHPMVPLPRKNLLARQLALGWLWLGVYALIAAGIMSLFLAVGRTPVVQQLMPGVDLFKIALVVHVDLSAVIWFFACAGLLWILLVPGKPNGFDVAALALTVIGTVMISAAPVLGAGVPLMNNYVPVLQHPWFFAGLLMASTGLCFQAGRYLAANPLRLRGRESVLPFAMSLAAVALLLAMVCFVVSYLRIPQAYRGETYYELLFWGGGHVLQFAYTLMVLAAWGALLQASGTQLIVSTKTHAALFALTALPLLAVPWLYRWTIDSREHILGFTYLMRWGGLASLPLGVVIFIGVFARRRVVAAMQSGMQPLRAAVLCSMTLFAAGGIIGFLIKGSNTMIPAHYHGSIVGVTLAFMGLIYYVLSHLGHRVSMPRTANWQPYVYAGGQLLHITGLAWSGGYGVQRKAVGAAQQLSSFSEVAGMGLMGLGGLISVLGGFMFLVVVIAALKTKPSAALAPTLAESRVSV